MESFDLQEAITGRELITRDGHPVRLICHDRKSGKWPGKLVALVLGQSKQYERIVQYNTKGEQVNHDHNLDLMLKS